MKPAQILSAILWSSLLLGTAAAPASASNVTIFKVHINSSQTQLKIKGQGFTTGGKVTLGVGPTDITSQCSLASAKLITCTFGPPAYPSGLTAGEYRLTVFDSNGQFDVFDLTTPLVGPAGPAGPTGAIGPGGPAGPQGPAGTTGSSSQFRLK